MACIETHPTRRQLLLAGAAGLALAACGGGSGSAPTAGWHDRWQSLPMPFGVSQHATVAAADGSLLVIGGSRAEGILSDAVDRFDPATRSFTRIAHLSTGRGEHQAVRLADGRVLVVGGQTALTLRAFADLVDPQTGQARPAGEQVLPRVRHAVTRLADGRVLVTGGLGRDSAEIWDPASERWRLVAARMAHDRQHHTHTLLADGRVLIVGGYAEGANYAFAEIFDPQQETFAPLADARDATLQRRYFHAAHRFADGTVLVIGGSYQGLDLLPQASVLRIDPVLGRITPAPPLATPRTLVKSLLLPGDQVLMAGGQTSDMLASDRAAVYAPTGQHSAAALPGARAWHSIDALPDGRVIVIGGEDADGTLHHNACIYD